MIVKRENSQSLQLLKDLQNAGLKLNSRFKIKNYSSFYTITHIGEPSTLKWRGRWHKDIVLVTYCATHDPSKSYVRLLDDFIAHAKAA